MVKDSYRIEVDVAYAAFVRFAHHRRLPARSRDDFMKEMFERGFGFEVDEQKRGWLTGVRLGAPPSIFTPANGGTV